MSKECLLRKDTFYWMKEITVFTNLYMASYLDNLLKQNNKTYTPRTVRTVHCLRQHVSCIVLHGKFSLGATCPDADS